MLPTSGSNSPRSYACENRVHYMGMGDAEIEGQSRWLARCGGTDVHWAGR